MNTVWASPRKCRHCDQFFSTPSTMRTHFHETHREGLVVPRSNEVTIILCGSSVEQRGCQHVWVPKDNPDHCSECYMSFLYYINMEYP